MKDRLAARHTVLLALSVLFGLAWVHGASAGPPTDQLRDGVQRVVKILRDPQLAGDAKQAGREISANTIDVSLAPDGATPTALTAPAGTWSFSDYELLLVSGSYAITDQVGLSLTTMIPVTDAFFWVMLSGKAQILKAGSVRLALQGGITYTSYDGGDTTDSFTAGEVGGALTVCIDGECNSHLNGFLGAGFAQADQSAVPFIAAFLIYFREGVEAALLVGALLAGVRRLGRSDAARFIHAGWLAALPAGVLTWWVTSRVIAIGSEQRELVEAVVALLAAAVLFSVSFWMISKAESRHWMAYLKRRLEGLSGRNVLLLSALSFLAVYREAAETVLFTQALILESEAHRLQVWAGAAAGLAVVAAIALLMERAVQRLPLGPFFAVSGLLLCALAISFAGAGMYELVAAGYLPPRPVAFPEVPWMGIHPDLSALLVQLTIVAVIAGAAIVTLARKPAVEERRAR